MSFFMYDSLKYDCQIKVEIMLSCTFVVSKGFGNCFLVYRPKQSSPNFSTKASKVTSLQQA